MSKERWKWNRNDAGELTHNEYAISECPVIFDESTGSAKYLKLTHCGTEIASAGNNIGGILNLMGKAKSHDTSEYASA